MANKRGLPAIFIALAAALSLWLVLGHSSAGASEQDPLIMSGTLVDEDARPLAGAQVIARVERDETGRTVETRIAQTVADATGAFTLRGNLLPGTASLNPDNSVRIQLTMMTDEVVRHYVFNLFPPSGASADWTWSKAVDASVISQTEIDQALPTEPATDLLLKVAAGQPVSMTTSTTTVTSGSAPDYSAEGQSADERADLQLDSLANQTGTMAAIEAAQAARAMECSALGDPYWEDDNIAIRRYIPIHFDANVDKFMHRFNWSRTTQTSMSISYAGAGKNYAGGLSYSRENTTETGVSRIAGEFKTDEIHQWKTLWQYRKQIEVCYNGGYEYETGEVRWVPEKWANGTKIDDSATRFACPVNNRIKFETDFWVSRTTGSAWKGWFEVAGVSMTSQQMRTSSTKAEWLLKPNKAFGHLCGSDDIPSDAGYTEEVPRP